MIIPFFERTRGAVCLSALVGLGLLAGATACGASPVLTRDEASAKVLANGFRFVVKAEPATARANPAVWESATMSPNWDVWAVKDGIAYRVTVDGGTGDLVAASPAVEDD